jgi:hypothetical protein
MHARDVNRAALFDLHVLQVHFPAVVAEVVLALVQAREARGIDVLETNRALDRLWPLDERIFPAHKKVRSARQSLRHVLFDRAGLAGQLHFDRLKDLGGVIAVVRQQLVLVPLEVRQQRLSYVRLDFENFRDFAQLLLAQVVNATSVIKAVSMYYMMTYDWYYLADNASFSNFSRNFLALRSSSSTSFSSHTSGSSMISSSSPLRAGLGDFEASSVKIYVRSIHELISDLNCCLPFSRSLRVNSRSRAPFELIVCKKSFHCWNFGLINCSNVIDPAMVGSISWKIESTALSLLQGDEIVILIKLITVIIVVALRICLIFFGLVCNFFIVARYL